MPWLGRARRFAEQRVLAKQKLHFEKIPQRDKETTLPGW
jgi:hypothetical protein